MGTLQNQTHRVFEMIAEACRELPVQLVISLGGSDDTDEYAHLPGNPITVGYAPQLELLQKASLCITHAGLNTALESIAHGVPMLAIPITNPAGKNDGAETPHDPANVVARRTLRR